jgi:hypothetical protein
MSTAATIVELPSPHTSRPPGSGRALGGVRVDGEAVVVDHLVLHDPALAAFILERPADDRPLLIERALLIGLTALQDAGVSVNVDVVRREFESLLSQTHAVNERAARALEETLRQNFADGDGRLPRTLERFLGDRGALQAYVNELFDPGKRDSAIGRMQELLGRYFDGDASRLAMLLDPTRMNSPLHQFRTEVAEGFARLNDRLTAMEAAAAARATERAKSTAKGADFEDLLELELGRIARGAGDLLDRTGTEVGTGVRSKKGDFVLTIDPALTGGADLRIVVEAKDRPLSMRAARDELREARDNRSAAIGLMVFTPAHAPAGIDPFTVIADDVYCVIDPEAPDAAVLESAVRLARLLALAGLREREVEIDAAAVAAALRGIREVMESTRALKSKLTSISSATKDVWTGLDALQANVLQKVALAEQELRIAR